MGRHGGGSILEKLKASSSRTMELCDVIQGLRLDYAISFNSPECARVAFGMDVKHVCISDSPHSEKVCKLTVPLSDILCTPWVIPYEAWRPYGISEDRLVKYRALDPVAWLRRRSVKVSSKEDFGLSFSKKTITLRLEETEASYMMSSDKSYSCKLLNSILSKFNDCEVFILGRYKSQIETIKDNYGSRVKIKDEVVDGAGLISVSDVFVGMGGTMTAEAALLGIPTVTVFQGGQLYVEDYLINEGLLIKPSSIKQVVDTISFLLQNKAKRRQLQLRANSVLQSMEDPINVIIKTLENNARNTGIL